MRIAQFKTVSSSNPFESFPVRISQSTPLAGSIGSLAVLLPTAAALLVPFVLLAEHLITEADARALLMERPTTGLQIGLALGLWAFLFIVPAHRLLTRTFARRSVAIDNASIAVEETGLAGQNRWQEPLAAYLGLAHHVRASVSGTRHELIMVHPNPDRSVLIETADRITEAEVARVAAFLTLPVVGAGELYRSRGLNLPHPNLPGLASARA